MNEFVFKWLLLCQESHASFFFSRDPLPYLLTRGDRQETLSFEVSWRLLALTKME